MNYTLPEPDNALTPELYELFGQITYIIPVEDGSPFEASLLQGFARSLMDNFGIIRLINTMPSDIWELTPEGLEVRLPRRMSGQAPVIWRGQSQRALKGNAIPPFMPFAVLFLGQDHKIEVYRTWIDAHSFPLPVVAEKGGTISFQEFGLEALRHVFRFATPSKGKLNRTPYRKRGHTSVAGGSLPSAIRATR